MARATRTLNPLHFEDLEPHRFEDLIRQLIYDFRNWRSLEALGRSGSDEGIDIRGIELTGVSERDWEEEQDGDEDDRPWVRNTEPEEQLWIIQCKRERSIGPQKVRSIITDYFSGAEESPYGYILAAACDFSKAARDTFRGEMLTHGVKEFHIWGKAEIEDQLFLPKNDHLLFAYFNISLQTKRRSIKTLIRSRLSLKRKLVKELGGIRGGGYRIVLIRDPHHEDYPFIKNKDAFLKHPLWRYWEFHSHQPPNHIAFIVRKFYAYANWETKEWDILPYNMGIPTQPELSGLDWKWRDPDDKMQIYRTYWDRHVLRQNQAWAIELAFIHYDRIIAFDDIGDSYNEGPHLLVDYTVAENPFERHNIYKFIESAQLYSDAYISQDDKLRIPFFPKEIPDERKEHEEEMLKKIDESREK